MGSLYDNHNENILLEFEISCCEMEALRLCGK